MNIRPIADAEEFFSELEKHGEWFKGRSGHYFRSILVKDSCIYTGVKWIRYEDLLEGYTWRDGEPCGIRED